MSKEAQRRVNRTPITEEEIHAYTIGELKPLSGRIPIVDYDPRPELFAREADRIRSVLGSRALRIEHGGSTSVPGLAAKPIIDLVLVVADSAEEETYAPALEAAGYVLRVREPDWYERDLPAERRAILQRVMKMQTPWFAPNRPPRTNPRCCRRYAYGRRR